MKTKLLKILSIALSLAFLMSMTFTPGVSAAQSDAVTVNLRTDYKTNPTGIDSANPVFSWEMKSSLRGILQTHYGIIVRKDSPTGAVVWNSGKIADGRSANIEYDGDTLLSQTVYYWTVRVFDNKGGETPSETASFETALLDKSDWDGAKWIKHSPDENAPVTSDVVNYTISMDVTIKAVAAGICFAGVDASHFYMWQLNIEDENQPKIRAHRWNGSDMKVDIINIGNKDTISKNKKVHVEFKIEGKFITTSIDGTEVNKYENSVNFGYGKLGFRSNRAEGIREAAAYDDIKVETTVGSTITTLFEEKFDNASDYQFNGGRVADGQFIFNDDESVAWDAFAWQKDAVTEPVDLHYAYDMDFQITKDNVGVIFAAKNTGNFLMWAINTDKAQPYLRRHIYTNNTPAVQDITLPASFTKTGILTGEHHLKIEVLGNAVKTYVDTVLVDTYTDTAGKAVLGYFGFRFHNEGARFDNVKVINYNAQVPTTLIDAGFDDGMNPFSGGTIVDVNGNKKLYVTSSQEIKVLENRISAVSMYRKEFTAKSQTIKSARIYASSLGVSDLYINGERVGTKKGGDTVYDELKPGWTDYDDSVFYLTYDVTDMIKPGGNAIGAEIGSGWYNGIIAVRGGSTYSGLDNGLLVKLQITYADGSTDTVVTDNTWKTLKDGNVTYADIYNGEIYDANKDAIDVWSKAGYGASAWYSAKIKTDYNGAVKSAIGTTVQSRDEMTRTPESITKYNGTKANGSTYGEIDGVTNPTFPFTLKKGETVILDMGQNMVGWEKLSAKGTKGTVIDIRFAEMLNDSGEVSRKNDGPKNSIYTANYLEAKSSGQYIMNGNASGETYNPRFTFYGFRYVELKATEDTVITDLKGIVVGNANEENSSFESSDTAVNQLYSNIIWGQRDNFLSTATDCPQRNERLGWTADTHIFSRTATYNADTAGFYRKWLADMRDSQFSDGAYPDVAPNTHIVGGGNGGWAEAGIIVPYNIYLMYGDTQLIKEHFASMEKFMVYLASKKGDGYLYNGGGAASGDWAPLNPSDNTDAVKRYISVTYYAYSAMLMAEMSAAIGNTAKEAEYKTLYDNIKNEFNTRYVNANGTLKVDTQTAYLLALKLELFKTEALTQNALDILLKKIKDNGNKLSTGFIGTSILNQTLSDVGATDMAYTLLLQRDYPSWLYSVDQGATTIWENWDSYTIEKGFKDPGMNSFNHYAYGAVGEWMFRYMAGIEADAAHPGFKSFILQPTPDTRAASDIPENQKKMTSVKASYGSIYGEIKSEWQTDAAGRIAYKTTVPANTTATLSLPIVSDNDIILLDNVLLKSGDGVTCKGIEDGKAIIELGSGTFDFRVISKASLIPVTGIIEVPLTAAAGTGLPLSGTVLPSGASFKDIVWSVKNAGTTGAVISGNTLSATSAGTVVVTATILNGTDLSVPFTKDFTITVTAAIASRDTLKIIIDNAKSLEEYKYTTKTWAALRGKITDAQNVYDKQDATSAEISAAVSNLSNAVTGLVLAAVGDVNGDGEVDSADILMVKNVLIDIVTGPALIIRSDVNGDRQRDIADIQAVRNIIISK